MISNQHYLFFIINKKYGSNKFWCSWSLGCVSIYKKTSVWYRRFWIFHWWNLLCLLSYKFIQVAKIIKIIQTSEITFIDIKFNSLYNYNLLFVINKRIILLWDRNGVTIYAHGSLSLVFILCNQVYKRKNKWK